jgi:hypothetical protein
MHARFWVKLLLVLCVLGILFLGPVCSSHASPVPEASFWGKLSWSIVSGFSLYADSAGIYSIDYAIKWNDPDMPYTSAYIATLQLTDGSHPMVDLQGSAEYVAGRGMAQGVIIYYLRADKKDQYAPDYVPLLVTSRGSFTVSDTNDCYARVDSFFGIPSKPRQDVIIDSSTTYAGAHWEGSRTITENVYAGGIYAILLEAYGKVQHNWETSGSFQAIIDPMVQIDPDWMVEYNGQMVPGAQLYSLTMSTGFTPVPLPSSLLLLGPALGCLAFARRRPKLM